MSLEILRLHQIIKYYGAKLILNGIDLSLNRGERLALVGENGVGKSTLARIILGQEAYDSGQIRLADSATIGYLPQEVAEDSQQSVADYIETAIGRIHELRTALQDLEQAMAESLSPLELSEVLATYGNLQTEFEQVGGYDLPQRMTAIFTGLGIAAIDTTRLLKSLSGGERTRVALAALLLREPDLLLLDEPTNHLDFAGIAWLERYLADYRHALILITHDRTFINRVANQIAELHPVTRQIAIYHGTYEDYLAQREYEYQQKVAAYNAQIAEMKQLERLMKQKQHSWKTNGVFTDCGDKFLQGFKKGRGEVLQSKQIQSLRTDLEQLQADKLSNPRHEWKVDFRFQPAALSSHEVIVLNNLSKAFADKTLFANVSQIVQKGERVVLVAPNGTGKSTLLRLLLGFEPVDTGKITLRGKIGLLDQDGETLDWSQTVLECFREVLQGSDSELLAELHRSGLFADATLGTKRVGDLSVGQRRKLGLARLVASKANVLLLDEPTNHLDPLSLEALEAALVNFDGAMLAVSHDRRFVEKVATRIWHIENHSIVEELVRV